MKRLALIIGVVALLGAGCAPLTPATNTPVNQPTPEPTATQDDGYVTADTADEAAFAAEIAAEEKKADADATKIDQEIATDQAKNAAP
jgi:hypothetical protein